MTWQTVALAAINMLQIVLLAYLNRGQRDIREKVNGHLHDHMANG